MRYEVKRPRRIAISVAAGFPVRSTPPAPDAPSIDPRARPRSGDPRRFWREIRRNEARWLFLLVAVGAGFALSDRANRPVLLWSEVALAWRDALYLLLPWTGAVAAWTAGRERRHGLDELLAATARSPFRRRLWSWAAVSALGVAAFALVGAWLMLISGSRASASRFDLGPIVVGALAIPAFAAFGFALGAWQPRRATAFAALLGFGFVQIVLGQSAGWAAYLTATPSPVRATADGSAPALAVQQFWLVVGLIGLGLALLARVSAKGWAIRAALAASALVVLLSVAAIAGHRAEVRAAHAGQTAGSLSLGSAFPTDRS